LLDSLVAFAEVGDRLALRPSADFALTVDGPFADALGDPAGNLVARAIQALAARLARPPNVAVTLVKNLPVASGIGGGSADAAAALRGALRLWRMPSPPWLADLALGLGADLPVCLAGRACRMQGVGEFLGVPVALAAVPILLVNPGVATPTGPVFKARVGPYSPPCDPPSALDGPAAVAAAVTALGNDLEAPAASLVPAVAATLARLRETGALAAAMSGSGATCFAIHATDAAAAAAARALAAIEPGWWVAATRLKAQSPAAT
jgi:4-diphosphocytidyl-2-C-methyl-D-erythritol kinase